MTNTKDDAHDPVQVPQGTALVSPLSSDPHQDQQQRRAWLTTFQKHRGVASTCVSYHICSYDLIQVHQSTGHLLKNKNYAL